MTQLSVGFAMSGSFCTFDRVLMQVKELVGMGMEVTPSCPSTPPPWIPVLEKRRISAAASSS